MVIGFLGKSVISPQQLPALLLKDGCGSYWQLGEARIRDGANSIGPTMVLTVPPIRKSFGWKPAERIPTTFPCKLISLELEVGSGRELIG